MLPPDIEMEGVQHVPEVIHGGPLPLTTGSEPSGPWSFLTDAELTARWRCYNQLADTFKASDPNGDSTFDMLDQLAAERKRRAYLRPEPSAPVTVSAITEAMVKAFYTTAGYDVGEVVGPIERGGAGRANLVLRDGTLISLNVRLVVPQ